MSTQAGRVEACRRLHESGSFVMPNPWDVGSAIALERMGFEALATTSAGFAWTLGRPDRGARLDEALEHLRAVAAAVEVPLNADFEGGYAIEPEQVAANVKLAAATGIAGLSIEDSTGDRRDRDGSRAHRPVRGVRGRQARSRGDDPPATGVRRRGRRLPLRAVH